MDKNFKDKKAIAGHGIEGAKFALRGASPKVLKPVLYSKAIGLNSLLQKQDLYADNRNIGSVPSDMGYDGTYTTTAQDRAFETALGFLLETEKGLVTPDLTVYKKIDLYYEYKELLEEGDDYTVKVWLLNVEVGKPSVQQSTDANNITTGDYVYPIKIMGDYIMSEENEPEAFYRDDNGNKKKALFIRSLPGVEGYKDFEKSVPVPVIPDEE